VVDLEGLFSLTMWRSVDGFTVGVQRQAGDMVLYRTGRTAGEAIVAAVGALPVSLPLPPY
jgi:hypothetical protein